MGRGHLVGLVADHKIPAAVRRGQLGLDILVAAQLVEPGNDEIVLKEPVPGAGGLQFVVGEDLEREVKPAVQLVLPLFG